MSKVKKALKVGYEGRQKRTGLSHISTLENGSEQIKSYPLLIVTMAKKFCLPKLFNLLGFVSKNCRLQKVGWRSAVLPPGNLRFHKSF